MNLLHNILDANLKTNIQFYKRVVPNFIASNLNNKFIIRPYQQEAFGRFDFYYNNYQKKKHPIHLLYHMATGSGKTLVMAGLIIYLYKHGYRNFLFFVNSTNIINKTKDNFLNQQSSKYLFANQIIIDTNPIIIKGVANFQSANEADINIVFLTIQGLHSSLNIPKENSLTFDDFEDKKLVIISDEAHHINAETKKGLILNSEEKESLISWEKTVSKIAQANSSNILLEFTATADIANSEIKKKYADKLIFNYPLQQFRQDGYSKEVKVLQADMPVFDRALQAIIVSQYRKKIFEKYRQIIKPVILFKSKTIVTSETFVNKFSTALQQLTNKDIEAISEQNKTGIINNAFNFFRANNIDFEQLILELQEDFSLNKLLSVNSKDDSVQKQLAVNSLEDDNNNYRAIFAVDKLNEGWDVLNLFDIVKLYETTNTTNQSKPDKTTVSEAQLIGRGARYCPFKLFNEPIYFTRQFDAELNHELRICETLLYHSSYNPKYIAELHAALVEIGIVTDETPEKKRVKKYVITTNKVIPISNEDLLNKICKQDFTIHLKTGEMQYSQAFEAIDSNDLQKTEIKFLLKDFGEAIIRKAINSFPFYEFINLQKILPGVNSISAFISTYLANISISVIGSKKQTANLSAAEKLAVCLNVLEQVGKIIY